MTLPRLARNLKNREAIRRKKFSGLGLFKRTLGTKKISTRGGRQLAIAAAPASSWICTSTSWSNMQTVESWIVEEDNLDEIEEGMKLFAEWTTVDYDDEEVIVEPETHDSLLMAALLSTKELLPSPSVGLLRALSCPDLLMDSLAALLFETRHCHYLVLAQPLAILPPPPQWMIEAAREMDPPNSLVSTVSLPSGWDAVSARQSSSSIFNLFSDPLSLSSSDSVTGHTPGASTVSVPSSFWDTSSKVSQNVYLAGATPAPSSLFFTSSTSSLFADPSEVSSSISSLFMDPSSAHSSDPSLPSSSSSLATCPHCLQALDPDWPAYGYAENEEYDIISNVSSGSFSNFVAGRLAPSDATDSNDSAASSGYETDVDSVPMDMATTVSATTQTDARSQTSTTLILAECDKMLEKLMEIKKKLREMM